MSRIISFKNSEGKIELYVNLDQVESAWPIEREPEKVTLRTSIGEHIVDRKQFEDTISSGKGHDRLEGLLSRLIDAVNRLTIHIPSSIRLHM